MLKNRKRTKHIILVGYARCGVTILNRVLSSDCRLICLSEINTRFSCTTIPYTAKAQLEKWYSISIMGGNTLNEIGQALDYSKLHKKHLVVRDWSFGSFVGCSRNNFNPTNTLNTVDDINDAHPHDFTSIGMVRNPVDVWLSMKNSEKNSKKKFYDQELEYYFNFVEDLLDRNIPFLKYEDFCANPNKILEMLYKMINIKVINQIQLTSKAIGDINFPLSSRGAALDQIVELERRYMSEEDKKLLKMTHAKKICKLLGYTYVV